VTDRNGYKRNWWIYFLLGLPVFRHF